MATATLTKQSVILQGGIYTITVHCEVAENDVVIWEGTGSGKYNPVAGNLDAPKNEILSELQIKYDRWVAEQGVYNSATLDVEVANLQTAVNAYINS